jgi:transposase
LIDCNEGYDPNLAVWRKARSAHLYRLAEIFARMGADIPDSTMVDWCGRAMKVLAPLIERIEADVMASDLLHAEDTPIRVLDKSLRDRGLGKGVKTGRIWAYIRDQRPWAGVSPPGAVYAFAPDWKEEHVHRHLANTSGILQADAYKGYAKLYGPDPDGTPRLREAACWAHLRRVRLLSRTDRVRRLTPRRMEQDQIRHRPRGAGSDRRAL